MNDTQFIVICRTDKVGRRKGSYVLATRQIFVTAQEASEYARTINASREPIVVSGRFKGLRFIVGDTSPNYGG